ncbi:hypothetical protein OS493_014108 [Desmophyllum pertusum]|uniref:Uncharacterized protein n=1 Tax=Desmophyllum pertusum TaxID=174260 RepID=A0A9W9ZFJ0_9CNID|nr:hypothetical protein OS493_014108 [Desmophyllum pertusum]
MTPPFQKPSREGCSCSTIDLSGLCPCGNQVRHWCFRLAELVQGGSVEHSQEKLGTPNKND